MRNIYLSIALFACLLCIASCSAQPTITSQPLDDKTPTDLVTEQPTITTEENQPQDNSAIVALDQAHARSLFIHISILLDIFGEDIQSGEGTVSNVPSDINPHFHRDLLMEADDSFSYIIIDKKCVSATYNGQTFSSDGTWSPSEYVPRSDKTVDASKVDAYAFAVCINGTVGVRSGDVVILSGKGDTLPKEIKAYFGALSENETWSFETNGLDTSVTYNGQTAAYP